MTQTNEKLILVDSQDHKIGEMEKMKAHKLARMHRAFSVFIFRQIGEKIELLIQQRNLDKYHSGGLWTNTCCSHPHPGEKVITAAKRRLKDEMGLQIKLELIGKFHYIAHFDNGITENEIDHVFVGIYNEEKIEVNPDEVNNFRWIDIPTLKQQIKAHPKKFTPWFNQALELALTYFQHEKTRYH
jgi:diphosphomevalonate decarboxylase